MGLEPETKKNWWRNRLCDRFEVAMNNLLRNGKETEFASHFPCAQADKAGFAHGEIAGRDGTVNIGFRVKDWLSIREVNFDSQGEVESLIIAVGGTEKFRRNGFRFIGDCRGELLGISAQFLFDHGDGDQLKSLVSRLEIAADIESRLEIAADIETRLCGEPPHFLDAELEGWGGFS